MTSTRPRPTFQQIRDGISEVSSALYALQNMAQEINDQDTAAYRFGALAGLLAQQLSRIYMMLDPYAWDELHPPDGPSQQEAL
jgi:hypothetical protein